MPLSKLEALASCLDISPKLIRQSKRDREVFYFKRKAYLVLTKPERFDRLKHCMHRVPMSLISRHLRSPVQPAALSALSRWTAKDGAKTSGILYALIGDPKALDKALDYGHVLAMDRTELRSNGFLIYRVK